MRENTLRKHTDWLGNELRRSIPTIRSSHHFTTLTPWNQSCIFIEKGNTYIPRNECQFMLCFVIATLDFVGVLHRDPVRFTE